MFFNVFQAAPENERDGPSHQAAQNAGGKVRHALLSFSPAMRPLNARFSSLRPGLFHPFTRASLRAFRSLLLPFSRVDPPAFSSVARDSLSVLSVLH